MDFTTPYSQTFFSESVSRIQACISLEDYEAALAEIEDLLEWLPYSKLTIESLSIVADLCDSVGLNQFSFRIFNLLQELYPANSKIVYRKALSAFKNGDTELALKICKSLPLEYWDSDLVLSFLVLLAIKSNDIDYAISVIDMVFSERDFKLYQGIIEHAIRIAYFYENDPASAIELIKYLDDKRKRYHTGLRALASADLEQYDDAFETLGLNKDATASIRFPNKENRRNALIAGYEIARRQSGYEQSLKFINQLFEMYDLAPLVSGDGFSFSSMHCDPESLGAINTPHLVSFIMTVHQWNDYFPVAVDSILKQSYKKLELIIVVDGDADDLVNKKIESLLTQDSRIRIERLEKNSGTYVAKNLGITKSKGDLIAFMDSDDWSHPQRIERAINQFRSYGEKLLAVADNSIRMLDDGRLMIRNRQFTFSTPISLVIRKSAIMDTIGYFDEVRCSADSEYLLRIKEIAGKSAIKLTGAVTIIQSFGDYCLTGGGIYAYDWRGLDENRLKYRNSFLAWHKFAKLSHLDMQLSPNIKDRKWHASKVILSDQSLYSDVVSSSKHRLVKENYPKLTSFIDRLPKIRVLETSQKDTNSEEKQHELIVLMPYVEHYESKIDFAISSLLNQSMPIDRIYVYGQEDSKPKTNYSHPKVEYLNVDSILESLSSCKESIIIRTGSSKLYARNYIEKLYGSLRKYNFSTVVGVEAVIVPVNSLELIDQPSLLCSQYIPNNVALAEDSLTNILGVESVAYEKNLFDIDDFHFLNSSIDFSINAQQKSIPMISIERIEDLVLTTAPKSYSKDNQVSNLSDFSDTDITKISEYTEWRLYWPKHNCAIAH